MKNEQDNLEKLLEEELKKEADQILAELEADESLKNIELPGDLDTRMMERIRKVGEEKEMYARLSEKDREALRIGREAQILRDLEILENGDADETASESAGNVDTVEAGSGTGTKAGTGSDTGNGSGKRIVGFRRKMRKGYLVAAAVAVLVIGMGVNTVGEAPMFTKVGKLNVGNREIVQIDSAREGENNLEGGDEESSAYDAIVEAFGAEVVRIQYLPNKTTFLGSDIDTTLKRVYIFYKYEESIIEYQIMLNYLEQSAGYDIEDNLVKEESVSVSNVPISIKKYMLLENQKYQMVAEFKYKDVYYILNAPIDEREFLKIIKKLEFF